MISFGGLTHLLLSEEHFGHAPYLGFMFLANFAASSVAAFGLARGGKTWAWLLGCAVCGGALAGLLVSRTLGFPGYPEAVGQWFNLPAFISLGLDLAFLSLSLLGLTQRGGRAVSDEQDRIERERVPPATRETPEHFRLIERDMSEVRSRMTRDLSDLRARVEPKGFAARAKWRVRGRLRAIVRGVRR